ncbi:MAG: dihydrofolate reductase family protein [Sphaerochaetaceae bacterium]|nr:dihydrofolate reductase family protein [Sphaerochaetaceae bacterium]MDC7248928.1 dihydrofolate reductase family protein [Sphaerochaetaceae bacterium]
MKGKIILNLAISLDGYIATEKGEFGWIVGDGRNKLNTEEGHNFPKFLDRIDIVVMGHHCFLQGFANDFPAKRIFVATNESKEDEKNIHFIKGNIVNIIKGEQRKGNNIYLFGGSNVIDSFIKANVIDEYIIGIIPTILGKGIPLFLDNNPNILLELDKYEIEDGIPLLHYKKRKQAVL